MKYVKIKAIHTGLDADLWSPKTEAAYRKLYRNVLTPLRAHQEPQAKQAETLVSELVSGAEQDGFIAGFRYAFQLMAELF